MIKNFDFKRFVRGNDVFVRESKGFDKLNIPEGHELRKTVVISNPLGEDYSIMRTTTLNGILTLSTNY